VSLALASSDCVCLRLDVAASHRFVANARVAARRLTCCDTLPHHRFGSPAPLSSRMQPIHAARVVVLFASLAVVASGGCQADSVGDGSIGPDAGMPHGEPGARCRELARTCHPKDDGTPGELHDCHSLGHEGPEARCVVEYERCIVLCGGTPSYPDAAVEASSSTAVDVPRAADASGPGAADGGARTRPDAAAPDAAILDGGTTVPAGEAHTCADVADACRLVDPGTGPVHDCVALEGASESVCAARLGRCASLCGATLCVRLGSVCHEVDPGAGPIHDCHDLGHSGTDVDCFLGAVRCLSLCQAAR
jgi:hypothetical protein